VSAGAKQTMADSRGFQISDFKGGKSFQPRMEHGSRGQGE
jgi:hypothetical protein